MTEQIREAFEAFYAEKAGCNIDALRAARWGDNGYRDPFAASAWFGWQAALAQQPAPAMPGEDELQQRLQRRDEMLVKAQDHALKMGCRATALLAAQGEEPHGYVRVPRRWLDALLPPLAKGVTAGISFSEAAVNASNAIRELMAVAGDEFVPAAAPSALLLAEFRKRLQWYDGVDFVHMADIECALTEALAAAQSGALLSKEGEA